MNKENEHYCVISSNAYKGEFGHAIEGCWEIDGKLYVGNGEYTSEVTYCPFCGIKLSAIQSDE